MPTDQRRRVPRVSVNLPARWEGVLEKHEGNIVSLSVEGCFVLSGGKVEPGELIRLEIDVPDDEPIYVWGEVVDEADEIGFAVRFDLTDDDEDQARLTRFIQKLS